MAQVRAAAIDSLQRFGPADERGPVTIFVHGAALRVRHTLFKLTKISAECAPQTVLDFPLRIGWH
jgi:hypothetical protein